MTRGLGSKDPDETDGAMEELSESEDRYRRLVHGSPDAILIHANGRLAYANLAAAKLLGASDPDELIGLPALQIVHPDFHQIVLERIKSEESGEPVPMMEERFVRLDGSMVEVEVLGM